LPLGKLLSDDDLTKLSKITGRPTSELADLPLRDLPSLITGLSPRDTDTPFEEGRLIARQDVNNKRQDLSTVPGLSAVGGLAGLSSFFGIAQSTLAKQPLSTLAALVSLQQAGIGQGLGLPFLGSVTGILARGEVSADIVTRPRQLGSLLSEVTQLLSGVAIA